MNTTCGCKNFTVVSVIDFDCYGTSSECKLLLQDPIHSDGTFPQHCEYTVRLLRVKSGLLSSKQLNLPAIPGTTISGMWTCTLLNSQSLSTN